MCCFPGHQLAHTPHITQIVYEEMLDSAQSAIDLLGRSREASDRLSQMEIAGLKQQPCLLCVVSDLYAVQGIAAKVLERVFGADFFEIKVKYIAPNLCESSLQTGFRSLIFGQPAPLAIEMADLRKFGAVDLTP